jgi:hypothetical protein
MFSDLRNKYADKSWDMFNQHLEKVAPLNGIKNIKKKIKVKKEHSIFG